MKLALLALLALAACGTSHPLTYAHPYDPVWWVNPPDVPMVNAEPGRPQAAADWRIQASSQVVMR